MSCEVSCKVSCEVSWEVSVIGYTFVERRKRNLFGFVLKSSTILVRLPAPHDYNQPELDVHNECHNSDTHGSISHVTMPTT